jgi:hypothetical protein
MKLIIDTVAKIPGEQEKSSGALNQPSGEMAGRKFGQKRKVGLGKNT